MRAHYPPLFLYFSSFQQFTITINYFLQIAHAFYSNPSPLESEATAPRATFLFPYISDFLKMLCL